MVALALLFGVMLGAMRALPDRDAGLQGFLLPDDCAAPCWLGIRPGVTTTDEAVAILQAHPWVSRVAVGSMTATYTTIYWVWSEQGLAYAEAAFPDNLPYLRAYNGIVQYIHLSTRIPYGEARLLAGTPGTGMFTVDTYTADPLSAHHVAGYFDGQVVFETKAVCPVNSRVFWEAPASVTYSDGSIGAWLSMPDYDLSKWLYQPTCQP